MPRKKGISKQNRVPRYEMSKRIRLKYKLMQDLAKQGHDMGFWYFSEDFPHAECSWCKKCGKEVVLGLPLISPIGEVLNGKCEV